MPKTAKAQGLFETIKEKANDMVGSFDFSNENLIKLATYLGVGFGIGFSLKKFGTFLLFAVIIAGCALYGLQYFDFISIDIEKLKLFLGFSHKATLPDVINLYWDWIKNHVALSVSFCIGFFLGYKLG